MLRQKLKQEHDLCGRSSVVERHVANVNVVGSTPIARSNSSSFRPMVGPWSPKPKMWVRFLQRVRGGSKMVMQRIANPPDVGSSPIRPSNFSEKLRRGSDYPRQTTSWPECSIQTVRATVTGCEVGMKSFTVVYRAANLLCHVLK